MPMATAVWLVENTTLTFKQIANFCNLHEVEVQGIADGEVAKGIKPYNPIMAGQLTREEINLSSKDENRPLEIKIDHIEISGQTEKIKKYVPLSKRQDKPDSALWLLKHHSQLKDSQIAKLVGITKNSVTSIRNKSYWNFNNLNPKDPVSINLFSQNSIELRVDNDLYFSNDEYYSSGVFIKYEKKIDPNEEIGKPKVVSWVLAQKIYNPLKRFSNDVSDFDYPYGGWLYLENTIQTQIKKNFLLKKGFQLGLTGDASLARWIQNNYHDIFLDISFNFFS